LSAKVLAKTVLPDNCLIVVEEMETEITLSSMPILGEPLGMK